MSSVQRWDLKARLKLPAQPSQISSITQAPGTHLYEAQAQDVPQNC